MEQSEITVNHIETKSVMTKSNTPIGGYSVNPYVGCPHACKYCYASFMKRFTGHTEEWGTFMDVKDWPEIKNPKKYAGQKVIIGTVTDGYNPLEETYKNTRRLLEELKDSGADILICTKSDLVLRDLDLLKEINENSRLTVSWSINTLLCPLPTILPSFTTTQPKGPPCLFFIPSYASFIASCIYIILYNPPIFSFSLLPTYKTIHIIH